MSTVIVQALQLKLVELRAKLDGVKRRLTHARKQVEIESAQIDELQKDVDLLVAAVIEYGGDPDHSPYSAASPPLEPSKAE